MITANMSTDLQKAMTTPDDVIALQLISRVILFCMTHNVNPLAMNNAIRTVLHDPNFEEEQVKAFAEAGKHWII